MKLQRTLVCIASVFIAVGFVTTQASAGGDPPGCTDSEGNTMVIEINALRASGKTVSAGPDQTKNVTAKARILKGTAVRGTTINTTLTIEALDGEDVISTNSAAGWITLEVGKGGNGAKLSLDIPQCNSGSIEFVATFVGKDEDGGDCEGTERLLKECK